MFGKRGQITIFVIIAIVLVGAVVLVYTFREKLFVPGQGAEFNEVYAYFDNCIKQDTLSGLKIAGTQAGYIIPPTFIPGNQYAPFSSQLDFLGNPVPYWYYISSNGILKEQVPSKVLVEKQLADFIDAQLSECDFSDFIKRGYSINTDEINSNVELFNEKVRVIVKTNLVVSKNNVTSKKSNYQVEVDSKFGKFFSLAKDIYDKEKEESFLENYSVDIMMNYAPVTGSELSCAPKIWRAQEVVDDLKSGLNANIGALKVEGDYYDLNSDKEKYFVVKGLKTEDSVRFTYDPSWPTRIEIWPADNNLLIADSVGLEQGMGIIGFCYVPYHFVYDIYYPVLIQIYDGKELFQFPVSVVIDKSVPREAIKTANIEELGNNDELCNYKNTNFEVYSYDHITLAPVEAEISFSCLNTKCGIGKTKTAGEDAKLSALFPQCINGEITARAEGYLPKEIIVSTNEKGIANVPLTKLYNLDLKLIINGLEFKGDEEKNLAIINFESENNKFSVAYPQQKTAYLSEGYYNISIQVFSGADLTIPEGFKRQCVDVPSEGLLGFFGKSEKQCFDITIPSQTLTNALSAGGKLSEFILENDLKNFKTIEISVGALPTPSSLEQLQQNYELINNKRAGVRFS